ncbi:MAG TPA: hypothetical protein VGH99_00275 [Pseudonocardia sp.]|jgi:hypothetical protein
MVTHRPTDPAPGLERDPAEDIAGPVVAGTPWIDRLVELHVLAEHGDTDAASAAREWIAVDVHARTVWDHVEGVRDQLRASPPTGLPAAGPQPG